MASKRKFAGENSQALVPVKKQKQHQVALLNQGGGVQAVGGNGYGIIPEFFFYELTLVSREVRFFTWCALSA